MLGGIGWGIQRGSASGGGAAGEGRKFHRKRETMDHKERDEGGGATYKKLDGVKEETVLSKEGGKSAGKGTSDDW